MIKDNPRHKVVVDDAFVLQPMNTVPLHRKVILMNPGGVLVFGTVTEANKSDWKYWAPLPVKPREEANG